MNKAFERRKKIFELCADSNDIYAIAAQVGCSAGAVKRAIKTLGSWPEDQEIINQIKVKLGWSAPVEET